ncbi:unnamed protein product [Orchesella dallaii]|uniref:Uncharacterized protein n=1 Tax=Orchesella dallaii TaxID=48710 RepID=A0ABP1QLI2_9HEXA
MYISSKKVINYVPSIDPTFKTYGGSPYFGSMEDILNSPEFKNRDIAQDPDVWGDALAVYEKLVKNRGRQVDPKGYPIGFYPPGMFSPFANPILDNQDIPAIPIQINKGQIVNGHPNNFDLFATSPATGSIPDEVMTVNERFFQNSIMTQAMLYRRCGGPHPRGKVCYGVPSGCIEDRMCRLIVTFGLDDTTATTPPKELIVHLAGETSRNGFVAMAFSHDRFVAINQLIVITPGSQQGQDFVVYCINAATIPDPKIALYFSYTDDYQSFMQIHVLTNVLSIPLLITSTVSILVELDFKWRSVDTLPVLHSISGIISLTLLPVEIGTGVLLVRRRRQPSVDDDDNPKLRKCSIWSHWLLGNLSYIFGSKFTS